MHQNSPYWEPKSKIFLGRGLSPLSSPLPGGEGTPPHHTSPPRRLRRLDPRAFGAQRSRSFLFTTRTLSVTEKVSTHRDIPHVLYRVSCPMHQDTCLHVALSCASASSFLQLSPAVLISFPGSIFHMFFGRPPQPRSCGAQLSVCLAMMWHYGRDIWHMTYDMAVTLWVTLSFELNLCFIH